MKKITNKSFYQTVMCIITFLVCLFFIFLCRHDNLNVQVIIFLLTLLPFLLFLWMNLLIRKKEKKEIITIISLLLSFFIMLFYYPFCLFYGAILEVENPITNIKKYKYLVDTKVLKTFPKEIPKNVENVKFLYAPRILQGDSNIVLSYTDNAIDIKKFQEECERKSKWNVTAREYQIIYETALYQTIAEDNKEGYAIYFMEADCDDSGYCNHGSYLMIAINEKEKSIIHKYSIW